MARKRIAAIDAAPALYLFGIAWFLPYSIYTLWIAGLLNFDFINSSIATGGAFEAWWVRAAKYSIWITLLTQLSLGVLLVWGSKSLSWRSLGFCRTTGFWFLCALAALIMSYLLSGVLHAIFQIPGTEAAAASSGAGGTAPAQRVTYSLGFILALLLMVGPVTAVIEEVAFRGVLYGWLRSSIGPMAGILVSSALFAFFHLRFFNPGGIEGISATLQVGLCGVLLALLYEKCGSLWPSIYLHCLNNGIGVLQLISPR